MCFTNFIVIALPTLANQIQTARCMMLHHVTVLNTDMLNEGFLSRGRDNYSTYRLDSRNCKGLQIKMVKQNYLTVFLLI